MIVELAVYENKLTRDRYQVLCVGCHVNTGEKLVTCRRLYGEDKHKRVFPAAAFSASGYFSLVDESDEV